MIGFIYLFNFLIFYFCRKVVINVCGGFCLTFVVSLTWKCGFEYDILGVGKGRDRFESEGDEKLQERDGLFSYLK